MLNFDAEAEIVITLILKNLSVWPPEDKAIIIQKIIEKLDEALKTGKIDSTKQAQ